MWRTWLIALVCAFLIPRPSHACGSFHSERAVYVKVPPRLGLERTLVVWDSTTKVEHFVREVQFEGAADQFGFVVPTPSRPSVHAVEKAPFEALALAYDASFYNYYGGLGLVSGTGYGAGFGATTPRAAPVTVLEEKKLGDFTAFVIEATDSNALTSWLRKHGFATTKGSAAWIAHHVALRSYFVALRYDAGKDRETAVTSRTLRISFATELPYYPYREPEDAKEQHGRRLDVWLVSDLPLIPLAGLTRDGAWSLRRPWSEGERFEPQRGELEAAVGHELAPLLPSKRYVQTFVDAKPKRAGFHDVVFAPESPRDCDAACEAARAPLLERLDPSLVAKPTETTPTPPATASQNAITKKEIGCGVSLAPIGSAWPLVLAPLVLLRRRWCSMLLGLALVACKSKAPLPKAMPSASVTPSASAAPIPNADAPKDATERKKWLLGALAGRPPGYVEVDSTEFQAGLGRPLIEVPDGMTDTDEIEKRCAATYVEGLIGWELAVNADGKVTSVKTQGYLPKSVLDCVQRELGHLFFSPEVEHTKRGYLAWGEPDKNAQTARDNVLSTGKTRRKLLVVRPLSTAVTGLPPEVVQRTLHRNVARLRTCYQPSVLRDLPRGKITASFAIDSDGSAKRVKTTATKLPVSLAGCVKSVIEGIHFPSPEPANAKRSASVTASIDYTLSN